MHRIGGRALAGVLGGRDGAHNGDGDDGDRGGDGDGDEDGDGNVAAKAERWGRFLAPGLAYPPRRWRRVGRRHTGKSREMTT